MPSSSTQPQPEEQASGDSDLSQIAKNQLAIVLSTLDEGKAENIVNINLAGKSTIADQMVVCSGRSTRQVGALADQVLRALAKHGHKKVGVEGLSQCDWVLLDIGSVIVHIFRPEVREFYSLEKLWSASVTPEAIQKNS